MPHFLSLKRVYVQLWVILEFISDYPRQWVRTVFGVVIGDVGVIIEDLEEQQSYFELLIFLTATGNVRQVRQEFQHSSFLVLFCGE